MHQLSKTLLLSACLAAVALSAWAYDEDESPAPAAAVVAPAPDRPATRVEMMGVGACLGQGAGLFGAYFKFNPMDHLGFEATLGKRLYLVIYGDEANADVYWPTAAALKARYYFFDRTHRFNPGIEGGLLYAEDMGGGGEASGVCTFRISRHWHLDATMGVGVMPDIKEREIDYLASQTGHSHTYYEDNASYSWESPVMLFWGVGIAFMF